MSAPESLPASWVGTTIGDICTHPQYGFTTKATDSGKLKFLRTTDITSGEIDWSSVPYCRDEPDSPDQYLLEDGDVVISRAGSVGFSYLLKKPPRSVFASYLIRFRPLVHREYFAYFLLSPFYWHEIAANKVGIAVGNVNASKLREIPFPLAPLAEQRRIVAKIDELFSELDKGIENLNQARAQLAVYRQALLKHAFEGKLTADWRAERPPFTTAVTPREERRHAIDSWRFSTLGELTEYITSGSRGWAEYYAESGALFIRAQNLNRDNLDLSDVAYVRLPDGAEGTRTRTKVGDVFITITGANVTKAGFLDRKVGEAYVSQHVALCRPFDPSLSEYLYLYIISEAGGRRDLEKAAYGAGKPGLNLENLRTLEIPVPDSDEVPAIVAAIRTNLDAVAALESEIDANLQKSEALRQSILKKAFAGELVPQDPADEPAAALLARIRAERAAATTAKPAKSRGRKPTVA